METLKRKLNEQSLIGIRYKGRAENDSAFYLWITLTAVYVYKIGLMKYSDTDLTFGLKGVTLVMGFTPCRFRHTNSQSMCAPPHR